MKDSKLIVQIAGKLVVEGLTHEVVTKESAIKKTSKNTLSILMHLTIENSFEDVKCEMAKMISI